MSCFLMRNHPGFTLWVPPPPSSLSFFGCIILCHGFIHHLEIMNLKFPSLAYASEKAKAPHSRRAAPGAKARSCRLPRAPPGGDSGKGASQRACARLAPAKLPGDLRPSSAPRTVVNTRSQKQCVCRDKSSQLGCKFHAAATSICLAKSIVSFL